MWCPINVRSLGLLSLYESRGPACISLFFDVMVYTMERLSCTVALFYIHHGGDKGAGGVPNGERTGQVFPGAFLVFCRKWGPSPRNESPGADMCSLAFGLRTWDLLRLVVCLVSWVLSGILGLALNRSPMAACPHSQASEPRASAASLCRLTISFSRGKKKSLKNALGSLSYCSCKELVLRWQPSLGLDLPGV